MITIHQAVQQIRMHSPQATNETIPVSEALGRYLATDILSPEPSPRYTSSAMDGFGINIKGLDRPKPPFTLQIVGESAAGASFDGNVDPGQAVRVNTGAVIPQGVDTVVRVEDTSEKGASVTINVSPTLGQDIRHAGEEFQKDAIILRKTTKLAAPQLALLHSVGVENVVVFKRCTVSLLVTGSELVSTGQQIGDDQIRDSNMIMLAAAVEDAGGKVISAERVADDPQATEAAIARSTADITICTGGISVGRHDHVKVAAGRAGYDQVFWKIRQKPGKPLYFAKKGEHLFFGLPGNPVSAFMCFVHYIKPMIGALLGFPFGWPVVSAQVQSTIENIGKRPTMMRVFLQWQDNQGYSIASVEQQGSHMLTSITESNGYIILGPHEKAEAGSTQHVFCYDSRRDIFPMDSEAFLQKTS